MNKHNQYSKLSNLSRSDRPYAIYSYIDLLIICKENRESFEKSIYNTINKHLHGSVKANDKK